MLKLNDLKPAVGSTTSKRRVGRGIGSGLGKTSGRGHKGQKARAGGFHKLGFEGGQMPMQRRLPKFGFTPYNQDEVAELTTGKLNALDINEITIEVLKTNKIIRKTADCVKVILKGDVTKPFTLKGIKVSKQAAIQIEKAGGKVI